MSTLNVEGVSKRYAQTEVIKSVSFSMNAGTVCTLLGKNGSGKTTLLKMIAGLSNRDSGDIHFFGHTLEEVFPAMLNQMGFSIEQPKYYEHLSGQENLMLHLDYMGVKKTKREMEQVLKQVGLFDKKDVRLKEYSLGMKQRLAISRALVHRPRLVLLDEPFNGLDPKGMDDIGRLIRDLSREGTSFLVSSHLLHQTLDITDQVLLLNNGSLVVNEEMEQLKDMYGNQLTEKLIYLMEVDK